jgi:hypothetical protein
MHFSRLLDGFPLRDDASQAVHAFGHEQTRDLGLKLDSFCYRHVFLQCYVLIHANS